ncbi:MAG: non-canonical purine NTP pyrophosphatase [Candidatus Woesearchaeota archaeon]
MKFLLFNKNKKFGNLMKEELSIKDIDLDIIDFKLPIFSHHPKEFIKKASKYASNKLDEDVILLISSFDIEGLNGFPSFFSRYIENTMGVKNVIKVLSNMNRRCLYESYLAYCEPQRNPILFETSVKGKLKSFSADMSSFESVFVPNEQIKSLSNEKVNQQYNPNLNNLKKFINYINKKTKGFEIEIENLEITIFAPKEGNLKVKVKIKNFPKKIISLPIEKPKDLLEKLIFSSKRKIKKDLVNREMRLRVDEIIVNIKDEEEIKDEIFIWLKDIYKYSKDLKKTRSSEKYMEKYNEIQDELKLFFEDEDEIKD